MKYEQHLWSDLAGFLGDEFSGLQTLQALQEAPGEVNYDK
jgi:hypothetical protein